MSASLKELRKARSRYDKLVRGAKTQLQRSAAHEHAPVLPVDWVLKVTEVYGHSFDKAETSVHGVLTGRPWGFLLKRFRVSADVPGYWDLLQGVKPGDKIRVQGEVHVGSLDEDSCHIVRGRIVN
jgi:hypothetical protein